MVKKVAKVKKTKHYRPPGKKKEGNAARYMTRTQVVRRLHLPLPVFRKLCILKGVFPREPTKKVKGSSCTYYHLKDVSFLRHEPLLEKFREIRAYKKKITRALAKNNEDHATRLRSREPTYKLDRLVRERYPKFVDALRDLDDCLTMVHLFAMLPAVKSKIGVERIHTCRRLSHEWQAYISRAHKLRKVFISVKGIYYQAEVDGQKITWLTPHALQQVIPEDVDFNVMSTFLEFYETLLGFVNFRLYQSLNVKYPPILDPRLEALAVELYALASYIKANSNLAISETNASESSVSAHGEALQEGSQMDESVLMLAQLQHQLSYKEPGALMQLMEHIDVEEDDQDTKVCKKFFEDMKFFLAREVPRESLLFVIPAFGGMVSWDGDAAPFAEDDQSITHQVVDRPTQGHRYLSREYVQPQWVYDSINARIILPTQDYLVGRNAPPHLSPFVDNEAEGYVPDYAETIKRLQAAARNDVLPVPGSGDDLDDPKNLLAQGFITRTEAIEAAERKQEMVAQEKQYQEELKMEIEGAQHSSSSETKQEVHVEGRAGEEEEGAAPELEQMATDDQTMSRLMMSRKRRWLFEAMVIGKQRKLSQVSKLKERKKKLAIS